MQFNVSKLGGGPLSGIFNGLPFARQHMRSMCERGARGVQFCRTTSGDWLRNGLLERDITPIIPPKSKRRFPAAFDRETYKWWHRIENYSGKMKESRGIAMRSSKTDQSFKAFISIAATIIQTR